MAALSLKWPDYLILAAFLLISLAIGLYHSLTGGRQKTTAEFIMADRRLSVLPTAISLLVSFQSAIAILGLTAEMYSYGAQRMVLGGISYTVSMIIIERVIVPWMYPLKLVSVFEYVYIRFRSKSVHLFAASLGIMGLMIYVGIAMYAPSAALESVTGIPVMLSVPTMAVVCITYTSLGGMRAVIWTDVFQFLTMICGLVAVAIQGIVVLGGIGDAFKYAGEEGRLTFVDWSPDPTVRHTIWGLVIGGAFQWVSVYGMSQSAVQRYSATETITKARATILLNIPGILLVDILASFTGLVCFAYYAYIKCDPLQNKEIRGQNQLLPYFVLTIFSRYPGFVGLFLATLYGGALSTVSSGLSGLAANCWEDLMKWKLSHLSETTKTVINRILVVFFGGLATGVAFIAATQPGPIYQLAMALCGIPGGPVVGILLLGGISKYANWKGALIGGVVGIAFSTWLMIGAMIVPSRHPTLPPLSTDGCPARGGAVHYNSSSESVLVFQATTGDYLSLSQAQTFYGTTSMSRVNTSDHGARQTPQHLHGIQRFYSISYTWYVMTGTLITCLVGMIASLLLRDKEMEKCVEDRLLIHPSDWLSFRQKKTNHQSSSSTTSNDSRVMPRIAEWNQAESKTELTKF